MINFFRRLSLITSVVIVSFVSFAQTAERCATMQVDSILRSRTVGGESLQDFENWLQQKMNQPTPQQRSRQILTIPVIVHVVHNGEAVGTGRNISQAQVNSQIAVLNEDFRRLNADRVNTLAQFQGVAADIEIEFCPAQVDPSGTPLAEPGIHRVNGGQATWSTNAIDATLKPQTIWDPNRYFNIWTVDFGNTGLLGYAQFPQGSGLQGMPGGAQNANTDGVVCWYRAFGRVGNLSANSNRGRTATHEVGHWLGLRHIWGDGGCTVDDFCADTPPSDAANQGCNTNTQSCGNLDMVQNYMDYSNDACMNLFTQCQKTRMITVMNNSPRRVQLLSSNVCQIVNPVNIAGTVRDAATQQGIPNAKVRFNAGSTNYTATCNAQGNFVINNIAEGTYTFYAGQWGYVTKQLTNVNVQQGSSPIVIDLEEGYYDDFVLEFDWNKQIQNLSQTATGAWVRGIPVGTLFNNVQSAPGADVTMDFGNEAYITGNGGGAAGTDDVDDAIVTLTSPSMNLSAYNDPRLKYAAWFYNAGGNGTPNDSLVVRISNGQQTVTVERITSNVQWVQRDFRIRDFITPTANMTVSFIANDDVGNGHLVEGGVDYFRITDTNIVVTIPPVADFSATNTTGCAPRSVSFTDLSSNNPTAWAWSFPGGTPATSTQQNPTVTYSAPGTYAVTLTATNPYGNNTVTKQAFVVVNPPEADFNADAVSGCPGLRVSFTDITTCSPGSRQWLFPGGSPATSTQANPQVIYNNFGDYDVTLISGGDTIVKTNFISITTGGAVVVLNENFENGFATNGWSIENPDNAITWAITAVQGNLPGTNAAYVNHYAYGTIGQRDRLVSKSLDLSNVINTSLTFKHAHRRYLPQGGGAITNRDSLIVYASGDGGNNWNVLLAAGENGQGSFATAGAQTANFVPTVADDWCFSGTVGAPCFTVDLSAYDGNADVRIRFESYNDYGNNTFIDDVVVSGICANVPDGPVANFSADNTAACGSLTVNFTDASVNNPDTWEWTFAGGSPASSTDQNPTVTYNTPGTYAVKLKVSNANGSDSLTLQGYIVVNDFPAIDLVETDITCNGLNNGTVTADITNGVSPVEYLWSNGATTATVTGLSTGVYDVTITSGAGCSATAQSNTITEPDSLQLSIVAVNEDCNQGNGSLTAIVTGGTAPYVYDWSNGVATEVNDNVSSGIYELIVADANNCAATETAEIFSDGSPVISVSIEAVTCAGGTDGEINVSVSGGTAPYGYNWNNGANTPNLFGLVAGSYLLTVTDDAGCFETISVSVNEPDSLLIDLTVTDIPCGAKFGSILAEANGGIAPYSYAWSNNTSAALNDLLDEGTYTVTVTDDNGCTAFESATVIEIVGGLLIDITITPDNGSGNGSAIVNMQSGTAPFQYIWSNGATTSAISNLVAGTYYLTVVDAGNCTTLDTVEIPLFNSVQDLVLNEVLIQPNPTTGKLVIATSDAIKLSDIKVLDVLGRNVAFYISNISDVEYNLDVSGNANGVYYITFSFKEKYYSKRIVLANY